MSLEPTPETRAFLAAVEALGLPPLHTLEPEAARAQRRRVADLAPHGTLEAVAQVEDTTVEGPHGSVPVRRYTPNGWTAAAGTLVYFHGGGWVFGDLDSHDAPCRALANAAGVRVVSVAYRLAPEHPHPAALEDGWIVVSRLGARPEGPLFVGGDSAGGHIATCLAERARGTSIRVAGQLLVYPVTDLSRMDSDSYLAFAEGYWLTRDAMAWFRDHYLGGRPADTPDVSPLLRADLSGMPPAVFVAAECDVLRDEGAVYARRLRRAGCEVTYLPYRGVTHGFWALQGLIPEGRQAVEDAAVVLRTIAARPGGRPGSREGERRG